MKKLIFCLAITISALLVSSPKRNKPQRLQQEIASASMIPTQEIKIEEVKSEVESNPTADSTANAQPQFFTDQDAATKEALVASQPTDHQATEILEQPASNVNTSANANELKSPSPMTNKTDNQDLESIQSSPQRKPSPRPSSPERIYLCKNSDSSTGSSWESIHSNDFDPNDTNASDLAEKKRKKYSTHQKSAVLVAMESLPDSIQQAAVAMFNPISPQEAITKKHLENIQQIIEERKMSLPDYLKSINPLDNGEDERQLSGAVHEAISKNNPIASALLFEIQGHDLFSLVTIPTQQKIKEHLEKEQKKNKKSFRATIASFLESFNKNLVTLDALNNQIETKTALQTYENITIQSKKSLQELTAFAEQKKLLDVKKNQ